MEIRQSVQDGDIQAAVDKANALDPNILSEDEELFFRLQQQRLIELIRDKSIDDALLFAQQELSPHAAMSPVFLKEMEEIMSLLVFADSESSPVGHLLSAERRLKVACKLNEAILESQQQGKESRLAYLLKRLVYEQDQLGVKFVFPRIRDLGTAELSDADAEYAAFAREHPGLSSGNDDEQEDDEEDDDEDDNRRHSSVRRVSR